LTENGGRYALIVAVSNYRDSKLDNLRAPLVDAKRLAAVLRNPEIGRFDVAVATNEEESQLRRRIATFFAGRSPEDLLLAHFSCHGVRDEDGKLYLAARDTEVGHMLSATGIAADWLDEQMGRTRSKRVVLMLDCCFSGLFPFGARARAGADVNVQQHLEGRGRAVITASNAIEYAFEGNRRSGRGQRSFFTEAVVEGLESGKADLDGDKEISVEDLYQYVYERVRDRRPQQNPTKMDKLQGMVYIAHSAYEAPTEPATLDHRLIAATISPFAAVRLGAIHELERLTRSNDPAVALAAHQTLGPMLDDDSVSVKQAARAVLHDRDAGSDLPSFPAKRQTEKQVVNQARKAAPTNQRAKDTPTTRQQPKRKPPVAERAYALVLGQPGITIPELAAKMGIKQNLLYRALPGLEQERRIIKKGRGWYPSATAEQPAIQDASELATLWFLPVYPGHTVPEIAAKMGVTQNSLSLALRSLEQQGKVTQNEHRWYPVKPEDRPNLKAHAFSDLWKFGTGRSEP
jgi:transposase-like protein